jgi:hypothetical protein
MVSPSISSSSKLGVRACIHKLELYALSASTTRVVRLDARPESILGSI